MTKLLLALVFLSATACGMDTVMVTKNSAWVRATPPGSTTTAIYLTLMNHTKNNLKLIGVVSDVSDRIELHTHLAEDGMMKMQQVKSIAIAAKSSTELKPHGNHLMIFNLRDELTEGDMVEVTLNFDDGSDLSISVPVQMQAAAAAADKQKHNH